VEKNPSQIAKEKQESSINQGENQGGGIQKEEGGKTKKEGRTDAARQMKSHSTLEREN